MARQCRNMLQTFHDQLISFLEAGQNNSDFEPAAMFVSPHIKTFYGTCNLIPFHLPVKCSAYLLHFRIQSFKTQEDGTE
jgi:hypothetical protein